MARVTIEDCLKNVESRFSLVHLAVRRVLQSRAGAPPQLDVPKNKEIVHALREIAAGKVNADNIRQLEEIKALPEIGPAEEMDLVRSEVKEILEEASMYDASVEFVEMEGLEDQQQGED